MPPKRSRAAQPSDDATDAAATKRLLDADANDVPFPHNPQAKTLTKWREEPEMKSVYVINVPESNLDWIERYDNEVLISYTCEYGGEGAHVIRWVGFGPRRCATCIEEEESHCRVTLYDVAGCPYKIVCVTCDDDSNPNCKVEPQMSDRVRRRFNNLMFKHWDMLTSKHRQVMKEELERICEPWRLDPSTQPLADADNRTKALTEKYQQAYNDNKGLRKEISQLRRELARRDRLIEKIKKPISEFEQLDKYTDDDE